MLYSRNLVLVTSVTILTDFPESLETLQVYMCLFSGRIECGRGIRAASHMGQEL